ncbi:MAG: MBL fold metallo-hydrolase [Aerococcaceae bacterium]|nr:MBL fold metallo-hydrolase [Aerococcaceae bacterium]
MQLKCLGCAGGYPSGDNGTTSFVVSSHDVRFHLLLDAGSGAALAMERYMDVSQLNAILVTHDHPDHVADLGIFQHLFMLRQPQAVHAPVPIYVHPHSKMLSLLSSDEFSELKTYTPNEALDLGAFRVTFCRTVHPVECYAVRIEEVETGEVLVFTADSGWHEPLIDFAKNADLLLADCAFLNEVGTNDKHFTAEEVGRLANEANVKQVVATHLPPQADSALMMAQLKAAINADIPAYLCQAGQLYSVKG